MLHRQLRQRFLAHRRRLRVEVQLGALQGCVEEVVSQFVVVLHIAFLAALFDLVERRLGDEDVPPLDQIRHLAKKESQQQGADVGAVHIGIRHDDDVVVAQPVGVELVVADAAAQSGDQGAHLLGGQHLVEARLLDIQNLAPKRQYGLGAAVPALFGRAAGGIPLH